MTCSGKIHTTACDQKRFSGLPGLQVCQREIEREDMRIRECQYSQWTKEKLMAEKTGSITCPLQAC